MRITAPPAFCYLPYVIRLSQKELQDQFKESFCCLAPSGSSLDRNNPFTSSLQRLSKVLNFCIIVSFALSFVKPKVGKKTACRQSEYKTQKTAPGKLPKAVFVQIVLRRNGRCRLRDLPQPVGTDTFFYRIACPYDKNAQRMHTRRRVRWLLKQIAPRCENVPRHILFYSSLPSATFAALAAISFSCTSEGACSYLANSYSYTPRPPVMERRSVQ